MKFTSEDLAKAMGLKIGDRVKVKSAGGDSCVYKLNQDYSLSSNTVHIHLDSIIELDHEIIPKTKKVGELICNEVGCANCPSILIGEEFEIVQSKKTVGEQLCGKIGCADCPLHGINCVLESIEYLSLYERLKAWHRKYKDDELYNFLKARLDKEVNDEK